MTDLEKAFEILGVEPTEDAKAIRTAWRALVRSYHPDTARTDPVGANKRLAEINVAFDAVSGSSCDEIKALQATIAKRKDMADRLHRESLLRQKQARERQEAAQAKARQEARAAASAKVDRTQQEEETSAPKAETLPVVQAPAKEQSESNIDMSLLVSRAEQGFLEAVKACSLQSLLPTRSSYA